MSGDWNNQRGGGGTFSGGNPYNTSGSLFSSAGAGSASRSDSPSNSGSVTTTPGWRLTSVTESGGAAIERTLDYLYLGEGGSWYEASYNGEGSEASHEWETTQSEAVNRIGTGTFATAYSPRFSPFLLGARSILSEPHR
ncbi:MAG: hypothetical protein KJ000_00270 [Pirellulaceae bacterium]|nr:hypothetical protein [Pirellulaceae bacterium]